MFALPALIVTLAVAPLPISTASSSSSSSSPEWHSEEDLYPDPFTTVARNFPVYFNLVRRQASLPGGGAATLSLLSKQRPNLLNIYDHLTELIGCNVTDWASSKPCSYEETRADGSQIKISRQESASYSTILLLDSQGNRLDVSQWTDGDREVKAKDARGHEITLSESQSGGRSVTVRDANGTVTESSNNRY